jgi:hypothetical protein
MEFRWIALIALWTLLAGPMFDSRIGTPTQQPRTNAAQKRALSQPWDERSVPGTYPATFTFLATVSRAHFSSGNLPVSSFE